ncbi:MAG TPA: alpha/beta hydrolase [Myxococcaceae bacterium]|nr:alpha/beta hydrolase [Myxococcaceae bacterium]
MSRSAEAAAFLSAPVSFQPVRNAEIAYRKFGSGKPLLLVHGWPLSGFTWRKLIPLLAQRFTCYAVDLPGAGETRWTAKTDFNFKGQAENLAAFVEGLGLSSCAVLAHDTGATISRQLALIAPERVERLVALGTEIPNHRPPWIPLYQKLTALPGAHLSFQLLMRSRAFLRSGMGFGGCFEDPRLLEGEFHEQFIQPLIDSGQRMQGQIRYLRGIDWALVDSLAERHAQIRCPVLLLWGEQDPVFPVERARQLVPQLPTCKGFELIPHARLFAHEEQPEPVARRTLEFLSA